MMSSRCLSCPAETPKGNANCPRRNGFFAHPDPAVCNKFYNCIDGDFTELPCTNGLHFDEYSGTCVWPDTAQRQGCVDKSKGRAEEEEDLLWQKLTFIFLLHFCTNRGVG